MATHPRDPGPPKKVSTSTTPSRRSFLKKEELNPVLEAAQSGWGHVFFVDAAHFVFGTFPCCLWSFTRLLVRTASGRLRSNVLRAWNE